MYKYRWLVAEGPRLGFQLASTLLNIKEYETITKGTHLPTIVIPGFGASNASTYFLRKTLNERHHNTIKWHTTRNTGFSDIALALSLDQVKSVADSHGVKVNIVGQSLGGCYARAVANSIPDYVNSVITLGTPINGLDAINKDTLERYNVLVDEANAAINHYERYRGVFAPNPPVPTTSIYSKSDGIVNWENSIITETDMSENIEIGASHLGMGFDLETIKIVANRLSFSSDGWVKYK